MSNEEQQEITQQYYAEAIRYMDNAKEILKKAGKEGMNYNDKKYVRIACGAAYHGILIALDAYLLTKGIKVGKRRKSIEFYQENMAHQDKKVLTRLNNAYQILHLYGYYDGLTDARVVKTGFDDAYAIIDKIKPMQMS
ncbi:MAG: DUF5618 family protein [Candidatus Symbiothrix sp.]|jgi:uncharacterized protein (UPF0332 family)|nr:DUF5618 family protein [Candidatus Symbiothrix sp.]